ncbi:expansin-like B1 [Rosa sericea]
MGGFHFFLAILGLVLLPTLCTSQDTFTRSRATYYGSPDCYGTPTGACGYGEYGRTVNDGQVSAVARLYRNGTGCGGCYQVRCIYPPHCSNDGVNAVVTDYGEGDRTDFIFSPRAYAKLANNPASTEVLFANGVVDIEFRRIPCRYSTPNLVFKVHEQSKFPEYLAIVVQYVAGRNDITAVEFWQEDRKQWSSMRRAYGAVWDTPTPPRRSIDLRFQVSGSSGIKWVQASNAIPADWKAGAAYTSAIQLH